MAYANVFPRELELELKKEKEKEIKRYANDLPLSPLGVSTAGGRCGGADGKKCRCENGELHVRLEARLHKLADLVLKPNVRAQVPTRGRQRFFGPS